MPGSLITDHKSEAFWMRKTVLCVIIAGMCWMLAGRADCAYQHPGDTDSVVFLDACPDMAGTKLDSCTLCHACGSDENKSDTGVNLGTCQWCHYSYGYDRIYAKADLMSLRQHSQFQLINTHNASDF
jgi:hypothetical protein